MPAERSLLEKLCLSSKLEHARLLLLVNCGRIVAKRKSAKQRCRKLACGQRLARPTSWAAEKYSWCGQVVEAAGCCVCAFGAGQECQTDQCKWVANCKGWPARRVKARSTLARGRATGSAASACLARFCFERSQKWAAAPFLGPFWQPLFS